MTIPPSAPAIASNLRGGENPEYTASEFRQLMPAFTEQVIPNAVLEHFISVANSVCRESRWHSLWREGMRLYVAHLATLYLESSAPQDGGSAAVAAAGHTRGGVQSKSVGSVSVSYDTGAANSAIADMTGWGDLKLTAYGVQYASRARLLGKGGMYIL